MRHPDIPPVTPMLCTPSTRIARTPELTVDLLAHQGGWVFEQKHDGVRALISYDSAGRATIRGRTGADVTGKFPELAQTCPAVRDFVLDGEIVGTSFAVAHRRNAQTDELAARRLAASLPVTFVVFDVPVEAGTDLRREPHSRRTAFLDTAGRQGWPDTFEACRHRSDGPALWREVLAAGGEGVVAKWHNSPYSAGRSANWVKCRRSQRVSALVAGVTTGTGRRAGTMGALQLVLVGPDGLVDIGKVGTGFTGDDLRLLHGHLARQSDGGPAVVVEVEYMELLGGKLRMPSYRGIRSDVDPRDCIIDQLAQSLPGVGGSEWP